MDNVKKKLNIKVILLLQFSVCIYSCAGIASKLASGYPFFSLPWLLCYGAEILILGIYAILWQQAIQRADISVAYTNREMAIFWSTMWAALLFRETITVQNIIGILIIFFGTWMVNRDA